jgi:hypothetical protein
MRWRRPVWKDMAQMATASATTHLGPRHAVAFVLGGINGAFNRIVEAWPTSATIEFLARSEEPLSTSGADEGAGTLFGLRAQLPGTSVPCARMIRYCSGVRMRRHSSSVWVTSKALPGIIVRSNGPRNMSAKIEHRLTLPVPSPKSQRKLTQFAEV